MILGSIGFGRGVQEGWWRHRMAKDNNIIVGIVASAAGALRGNGPLYRSLSTAQGRIRKRRNTLKADGDFYP